MIEVTKIIEELSTKRPIFHSEADFQHAFAWEIKNQINNSSIRLELPIEINNKKIYIDIFVNFGIQSIAIELKYKTRALQVKHNEEKYSLKNQSAQDIGRYDFIKDVERIEQFVHSQKDVYGYAILLTNDSAYWKVPRDNRVIDTDFRLHPRRTIHGTLSWKSGASAGTMKNREGPIRINGSYQTKWENYSKPIYNNCYGEFRYLMIEVKK